MKQVLADLLLPIIRAAYSLAPGRTLKWALARAFWRISRFASDRQHVVRTQAGFRLQVTTNEFIQRVIYFFGFWEPNIQQFINRRLQAGDVFVDIGANLGYFSLFASQRVDQAGKVVAIEASPAMFQKLLTNIALNERTNIRCVNVAVAADWGLVRMYRAHPDNLGQASVVDIVGEQCLGLGVEAEVGAASLRQILTKDELNKLRLVKIDVEGAEWLVVDGLGSLIEDCPSDTEFIVEIDAQRGAMQGRRPEEIIERFARAGYHAYAIDNSYAVDKLAFDTRSAPPRRLSPPYEGVTDFVFSRRDAPHL